MLLILYHDKVYREVSLEDANNKDYWIRLDAADYSLKMSVLLHIDNTNRLWTVCEGEGYSVNQSNGNRVSKLELHDGTVGLLVTATGETLSMVSVEHDIYLRVFQKYSLSGKNQITFGAGSDNDLIYTFGNFVSQHHGEIVRNGASLFIVDRSTNGIYCNGRKVEGQRRLEFGDEVKVFGLTLVMLGSDILAVDAKAGSLQEGPCIHPISAIAKKISNKPERPVPAQEYINRAPRAIPQIHHGEITIEAVPEEHQSKKKPLLLTIGPCFTMAIPMLMGSLLAIFSSRRVGGGAFMYTGIITALGSSIFGVIWAVLNLRQARKDEYEAERNRVDAYSNYLMAKAEEVRGQYEQNTNALNILYPPVVNLTQYTERTPELWNRNVHHSDFLYERLGTGSLPFQVNINIPPEKFSLTRDRMKEKPEEIREQYQILRDVPVGVDLHAEQLIGVVGGVDSLGCKQVVYNLVAGIAVNNCYVDVKLAMVCAGEETAPRWDFLKWLPHVWNQGRTSRFYAVGKQEADEVFYDLSNILRAREPDESTTGKAAPSPWIVLIVEDPSMLDGELISKYIFSKQPALGITTILLSDTIEHLPNSCEFVIENDREFHGFFHTFAEDRTEVAFDRVETAQMDAMARAISRLRVREVESGTEIPDSIDFLNMFGANTLKDLNIADRWRKNRTISTMRVPIGIKAGGQLCCLDIHEKYHGPHGLVAGTTGSGKSETLQSYILSLAVNFSPEDVGFFIIDFKGGGMANLFTGLPHLLGTISNLSGNQVHRAMVSIKSENRRRQRIFNEYGVNNINAYTRLYKSGESDTPVLHLFIIIDEFAELKREEPDFMRELISVAQVGRSLGVHLILSTQKPSGTVDDNIWSNSKFRLCLRVQDRQDSMDMLHKPDAAYITQTGRCFLQVGNDEIFEQFQSAWSGAVYDPTDAENGEATATLLTHTGKAGIVGNRVKIRRHEREKAAWEKMYGTAIPERKQQTQLEALVAYMGELAASEHIKESRRLWMPVLPTSIMLNELSGFTDGIYQNGTWPKRSAWDLLAPIGLLDDPDNQLQKPLIADLSANGHMAVIGSIVTGKSTFLQTLTYALILRYPPDWVNFYLLDFSSGMLRCFERDAHVGAVIDGTELDMVGNFMDMVERLIDERKALLRGGNFSQYVRVHGVTIPAIVMLIDNYTAFNEKTESAYEDVILRIAREGVAYGVFLVLSASDFGMNGIPSRVAENIKLIFALSLGDKFKYMEVLRTPSIGVLPEAGVSGRGLAGDKTNVLEFQTALSLAADDDYTRSRKIAETCSILTASWHGSRARNVPKIPEHPTFSLLAQELDYPTLRENPGKLAIGYLQKNASLYYVDLSQTFCYTVLGREHSGRANTLKILMQAAADKQAQIIVYEKGASKLTPLAEKIGATILGTDAEVFQFWQNFTPEFVRRNQKKRSFGSSGTEEELYAEMRKEPLVFFFISDLKQFFNTIYKPEGAGDMHGFMENILAKGAMHNIFFFGACTPDDYVALSGKPAFRSFTVRRSGVLLGGNQGSQRMFVFQNTNYSNLSRTLPKGIGLAANAMDDTQADTIVIPLAER